MLESLNLTHYSMSPSTTVRLPGKVQNGSRGSSSKKGRTAKPSHEDTGEHEVMSIREESEENGDIQPGRKDRTKVRDY